MVGQARTVYLAVFRIEQFSGIIPFLGEKTVMTVAHILKDKGGDIISVTENQTILEALQTLAKHRIGAVLVMDGAGKVAGILSERDIVRALPDAKGTLRSQKVSSIMTADVISCQEGDTVEAVMGIMTQHKIRHLPVKKGSKLVGVISIGDVVKARISEAENEAEALKQYIASG